MAEKHQPDRQISHSAREALIRAHARRQWGYFTRAQLLRVGLSRGAIDGRVRSGAFDAPYAGVYAYSPARIDPVARACAAVLACGDNAVLSHSSAAALWGMLDRWEEPFDVTAPTRRTRPGIRTHRATLAPSDTRRHLGIPATSPARTLLDIAPERSDRELAAIIADLRRRGLVHDATMAAFLERTTGQRGVKRLRSVAAQRESRTRSDLEIDFLAFAAAHGLPRPLVNVRLHGYEVDVLFADQRLVVELDGWAFHSSRASFEADRERDAALARHGYLTIRITWERIRAAPEAEARRLREILAQRG